MSEEIKFSSNEEAASYYKKGVELKGKGQTDSALTEFRRAILADPQFAAAQMEVGLLCKEKAKREPIFMRYAYDAFRAAAKLDLTHNEAHNQYIMAAQKMGLLDNLRDEYNSWAKQYPENALLQQSNKSVMALMLASIPQPVAISGSQANAAIRKVVIFVAGGLMLLGIVLIIGPIYLKRQGKIEPHTMAVSMKTGLAAAILGLAGMAVQSRLK